MNIAGTESKERTWSTKDLTFVITFEDEKCSEKNTFK